MVSMLYCHQSNSAYYVVAVHVSVGFHRVPHCLRHSDCDRPTSESVYPPSARNLLRDHHFAVRRWTNAGRNSAGAFAFLLSILFIL